ncbi:MAG: chemotaxis protein CheW [Planctomycetota bacterium]|nr:MAG: chemotaxis protein CheW [Planctomycetota bacterium]
MEYNLMNNLEIEEDITEEDTLKDRYLTFILGEESYLVDIQYVTEIIGIQQTTLVPETPNYIKGVINLRGKVIPIMDVRLRFKVESIPTNDRTCIVVLNCNDLTIGMIVDMVSDVVYITKDQIEFTSKTEIGGDKQIVMGMAKLGDTVKMLVDIEKLLFDEKKET